LVRLAEVCEEINDSLIPAKELPDSVILYTGLAHIESGSGQAVQEPTPTNSLKSAVKRYEPGDIVFAKMRPNLRKVALMDFAEGGYVSPECMVLRPLRNASDEVPIDPVVLDGLLRSDLVFGQITHLIAGIGRPRLSGSDLKRVMIPVPPLQIQQSARQQFEANLNGVRALQLQAARMLSEAGLHEKTAVQQMAATVVGSDT
jgi:hypothetical protein